MINEKTYQLIFDEVSAFLPQEWDRLVIYLEYGEDSYSFSFYVRNNKKYVKCYALPGIDEDKLMASFKRIDKAVLKERKKMNGEPWSNMTMTVSKDKDMHTDFDYTDLSAGSYKYSQQWKKKYLI